MTEIDARPLLALLVAGLIFGSFATWASLAVAWRQGRTNIAPEPRRPVPWSGLDLFVVLGGVIVLEVITQRAFGTGEAGGPPSLSLIVAILVVRLQGLVAAMAYLSLRSARRPATSGWTPRDSQTTCGWRDAFSWRP